MSEHETAGRKRRARRKKKKKTSTPQRTPGFLYAFTFIMDVVWDAASQAFSHPPFVAA